MILHIVEAVACGPYRLHVRFNDGTSKQVDLEQVLEGPIFQPLKDPQFFARVVLDPVCGTVVWPNGADFAPEALYEMAIAAEHTSA